MFLPESGELGVVAAENIAFGFAHIGDADRKSVAGAQPAFAVAGVLPKVPTAPWRSAARLGVIIRDPEPAIGKHRAMRRTRTAAVQHLL